MEEYLDVLDINGKMTGESATREEIHNRGLWHKTAQVILMNSSDEILIHKRSETKKYYPGMWDVYLGGHVLKGENSKEALIREVNEEVGLKLGPEIFTFLFDIKKEDSQNGGSFINNDFAEVYLARCDFDLNELLLQKDEINEIKFISKEKLTEVVKQADKRFIPRKQEYDLLFKTLRENDF